MIKCLNDDEISLMELYSQMNLGFILKNAVEILYEGEKAKNFGIATSGKKKKYHGGLSIKVWGAIS